MNSEENAKEKGTEKGKDGKIEPTTHITPPPGQPTNPKPDDDK